MVSSMFFEGFAASCKFSIYINMCRKLIGAGSNMSMIVLSSVKFTDIYRPISLFTNW